MLMEESSAGLDLSFVQLATEGEVLEPLAESLSPFVIIWVEVLQRAGKGTFWRTYQEPRFDPGLVVKGGLSMSGI